MTAVPIFALAWESWCWPVRGLRALAAWGWPLPLLALLRGLAYPRFAFFQADPVGQAPAGYWLLALAATGVYAGVLVALTRTYLGDAAAPAGWVALARRIGVYWLRAALLTGAGLAAGFLTVGAAAAVVGVVEAPQPATYGALLAAALVGVAIAALLATRWGLALPGTAIGSAQRSFAQAFDDLLGKSRRAALAGLLALAPALALVAGLASAAGLAGPGPAGWGWSVAASLAALLALAVLAGFHAGLYRRYAGTGAPPPTPDPDELSPELRRRPRG